MKKLTAIVLAAGFAGSLLSLSTAPVSTAAPALPQAKKVVKYANCAALNKKYPHGVGRSGAKDKVRGKTRAVKNFTVNTALYRANASRLDRDRDGIACEKR